MQLYLIGAGTPTPTARSFGTCYVLRVANDCLMFDCGPAATHKLVQAGLFPTDITHLFFTHHHYDHNADYGCFLLTRWNHETGREPRLQVRGPAPTLRVTERLIGENGAFTDDWIARVEHPGSQEVHVERGGTLPRPAPSIDVADIEAGAVITGAGWTLTAGPAHHAQPWLASLAYRVDSDEGSIAVTGDASPTDELIALCKGVDTVVVNCWDHQHPDGPPSAVFDVIAGTFDTARIAAQAGAKRLVIAHTLASLNQPGSKERAVADIARRYAGEIIFGEELMALDL